MNIIIPGAPIAKKRPRFFRRGNHVGTYNCQETEEGRWSLCMASQCFGVRPLEGPLGLSIEFVMPRPKAHYRTGKYADQLKVNAPVLHSKKPDLDNLIKFFKDAANGILWRDDSQIAVLTDCRKRYGKEPRTVARVNELLQRQR